MISTQNAGTETLSTQQLSRMIDNISEVVYTLEFTPEAHCTYVNKSIQSLIGYPSDLILSGKLPWLKIIHPEDRSRVEKGWKECLSSGEELVMEYRVTTDNGSNREVTDKARPIQNDKFQVVGMDGILIDNTERKQAQNKLDRTQMLQNIGKLTAGIAHEINTPIQFVGDNTRFLLDAFNQLSVMLTMYRDLDQACESIESVQQLRGKIETARKEADIEFLLEEIPQAIDQTLEGVKRVATMVSAMRDFSHIDERRFSSVDLNKVIRSTVVICKNEVKYVADVVTELDEDLSRVMCCQDDMNQVFLNMLINAAHSIEEKLAENDETRGLITIKTERMGDEVEIRIADTGTGIKPEIKEKIFEPFFTTKANGKGTGQGLSIIKSIICEKHAGTLELESELGKGTTFIIRLPIEGKQKK